MMIRYSLLSLMFLLLSCSALPPGEEATQGPPGAANEAPISTVTPASEAVSDNGTEIPMPEPTATRPPEPSPDAAGEGAPPHLSAHASGWGTDWSQRTIALDELGSGGPPRDGIPPIDMPEFVSIEEAAETITAPEPVVVLEIEGEAKGYPLAILIWHEIVNDEVGGQPVTITYCPLCNTAIAFDRRLDGQVLDFGTSGLLRNSDLVMWDRQTESLWQQVTGEAIVGELAGESLRFLPASLLSFAEFRAAYPDGVVLSRETGFNRQYGGNPYRGYDSSERPFLFGGPVDDRLPALERVVGLEIEDSARAYPFQAVAGAGVVNDEIAGQPVAIFYAPDTLSALDAALIPTSRPVGSAVAYNPVVDGQLLQFEMRDGVIRDTSTGTEWDIAGRAIEGPLSGATLEVLPHANHFWFAFAAFYPEAEVWEAPG